MKRLIAPVAASLAAAALLPASAGAAKVGSDFYGVSNQTSLSPTDAELMKAARVDTLRFHLDWRNVQGQPGRCQARAQQGVCDWVALDYGIGLFASAGVRSFPYVLNVPWFVDEDSNVPPVRSKVDRDAWKGFLEAAVQRYGRGGDFWTTVYPAWFPGAEPLPVTHWEIWNEPSDGSYWQPKPNAREYAKLVEISGRAIHKADQRADVVFAGLFGTPDETNDGIKAFKYYRQAFAVKGIGQYFDDIGVHPYGPTMKRVQTQMGWVREEMERAGFDKREMWITEIAWSSSEPPTILGVGPEGQAQQLRKSFAYFRSKAREWRIAGLHWYAWADLPPGTPLCEFCEKAGLVNDAREPKPSYYAFQREAK